MRSFFLLFLSAALLPECADAQHILYAVPGGDIAGNGDFQIIGKTGDNLMIYKNTGNYNPAIAVYDHNMQLKQKIPLKFLPARLISVDFIAYPEKVLIFYQYYHKKEVFCYATTLNSSGRLVGPPVLIDESAMSPSGAGTDAFTVISSEDKQKIMVLIIKRPQGSAAYHIFTAMLDKDLHFLQRKDNSLNVAEEGDIPANFLLSNKGSLVFEVIGRDNMDNSLITRIGLVSYGMQAGGMQVTPLPLQGHYLDTLLQAKIDNYHDEIYLASFYFDIKKRDIGGLFACGTEIDRPRDEAHFLPFNNLVKEKIRGAASALKQVFDDYLLRSLNIQQNGGFVVTAENVYPNAYMKNSFGDIAILSYDKADSLEWCNVIRKDQSDDLGYNFSSYQLINTGDQLHFIFNGKNKGHYTFSNYIYLVTDYSLSRSGGLIQLPLMRKIERKYRLMPRYARQVSANEVVMPFELGSELSFAIMEY